MKSPNTQKTNYLCLTLLLLSISCGAVSNRTILPALSAPEQKLFQDHWFQGQAEITRYSLRQARYGSFHDGDVVLIFVTEDFLRNKQVKLESKWRPESTPILKLNYVKKFNTGVYDYSLMASVFTPIKLEELPRTLKVTASNQEWCGHTFLQLNLRGGNYEVHGYSYFEREGDEKFELPGVYLEDEIWTLLRISPKLLPQGDLQMIPGVLSARLRHRKLAPEAANASFVAVEKGFPGKDLKGYRLNYVKGERELTIVFENEFPYRIAGWLETYLDGFGANAKKATTRAVRTHSMPLDYWKRHNPEDLPLRKKLGL